VILFPALDLWDGKVVKLEAARHRRVERVYGEPREIARRWLGLGAEALHVVDLNAALGEGGRNDAALGEILDEATRAGRPVQAGGGVRDDASLDRLLEAGVSRAIVGTKAIRDGAWLEAAAARRPGRVMVSIDGRGRRILVAGWQEEAGLDAVDFLAKANALPLGGYLYTNVAVEGRGEGVDWAPVGEVVRAARHPVVFSGGVSSLDDVARFKALGAFGIIAGSALYLGRFEFAAAKAMAS
jgi:phosphoribosylformimino-5-aminoimidazole carboxamide ribotide isomerase